MFFNLSLTELEHMYEYPYPFVYIKKLSKFGICCREMKKGFGGKSVFAEFNSARGGV